MLVKLKSGFFQDGEAVADGAAQLKRRALLVYAGDFESMNGPVKVSADQLSRLVSNHNSLLTHATRLMTGRVGLKFCPPIQLDHSASARDTVGRLVGNLEAGEHTLEDGTKVPAVFGDVLVLGKENVERVEDGRWTNLSLGVDFDAGKIAELTITPFPAAGDASFLSRKNLARKEVFSDHPDGQTEIKVELDEATGLYHAICGGETVGEFPTLDAAQEAAQAEAAKRAGVVAKLSQPEDGMDKTKLAAYLTGAKGMSQAEATAHLATLSDEGCATLAAEADAHDAQLASDAAAAAEAEREKQKTELTARRATITQLGTSFQGIAKEARLKAREGRILTRLTKLRAQAKITPAEIKKMDLAKLASSDDAAVELALGTYESREPVIMTGQLGSIKSMSIGKLGKASELTQLEAETRRNMSVLRQKDSKLAASDGNPPPPEAGNEPGQQQQPGAALQSTDPNSMTPEDAAFYEREYGEICSLMDGMRSDEAKLRIKAFMQKLMALGAAQSGEFTEANAAETEQRLSAVVAQVDKMSADFESLHKLATSIAGAAS